MKIVRKDNVRLEVFPTQSMIRGRDPEEDYKDDVSTCEYINTAIKRHVDDVRAIQTNHDEEVLCSFCESGWETNNIGMPLCCEEAQEEWRKENADAIIYKVSFTELNTRIHYIAVSKKIPEAKVIEQASDIPHHKFDDIKYGDDTQVEVETLTVKDVQ